MSSVPRPADGRYGENPNRLFKHMQLQVILNRGRKCAGAVSRIARALGIDLLQHDIKFEEDNWESPTLGALGIGWQVMLDGLEITNSPISSSAAAWIWIRSVRN